MSTITTKDGTQIYCKDWGHGQPIVFHHGWPLSSDDWDTPKRPQSPSISTFAMPSISVTPPVAAKWAKTTRSFRTKALPYSRSSSLRKPL
jgi:pimeloyl-ACP methyl ester carboxylesterase